MVRRLFGWIALVAASAYVCGCLAICRVPFPSHEAYSDDGVCTNRTWTCLYDAVPGLRVYPTVKMRCVITKEWLEDIDPELKGERLYNARMFKRWGWIPLGVVWLTSPVDMAIDTVFLPWDLYVSHADCCDGKDGVE